MAFRTTFYARHFCSFSTSFKRLEAGTSTTPAAPGGLASGLVGDHAGHLFLVRLVHHAVGIEMAFALGRLRSQDVALKRVSALELARTCLLEALGRSTVCLKLWHSSLSSLQQNRSAGTAYPFTDSRHIALCARFLLAIFGLRLPAPGCFRFCPWHRFLAGHPQRLLQRILQHCFFRRRNHPGELLRPLGHYTLQPGNPLQRRRGRMIANFGE